MTNDDKNASKNASKFGCLKCDFKCSKKSEWSRHILTPKHQTNHVMITNNDIMMTVTEIVKEKNAASCFKCVCGKEYKYRQGLFVHKKICSKKEDTDISDKEIIKLLIKENSEFKNMILEVVKTIQPTNNTINNNNTTNNNNFNLQIYLNETCKDALNLVDFVSSLKVQLKDLEETAKIGYTEGVSRIFINGLNELDVNMRPIHCSDAKRETLYIKNNNEWTKEDPDKSHIIKAVKSVSNKNINQIFEWQKKYPSYKDPESKQNDKYQEMIFTAMGGSTDDEQSKNLDKIIRNIAKEVTIDKNI
jgi:hypothetical protein